MSKPALLIAAPQWEELIGDALADRFEYVHLWDVEDRDALLAAKGKDVIVTLTTRFEATLLDRLPNLRLIVVPAAGYDRIDVAAARARGVIVANAGNVHSDQVADYAVALTLAAIQRLPDMQAWVRGGRWARKGQPDLRRGVSAQRFGIVGLGNIGTAVAERLVPFGGDIGWWGPHKKDAPWPRFDTLLELAHWCTALIVAARGDATGLIDAETIAAVGAEGLIVNIARGAVVDEDALIAALEDGRLGHAALDVFIEEPTPPEHWRDVPNVILSPHAAGLTHEAIAHLRKAAIQNVASVLDGGPVVNEIFD
ncbi:MAG: NAD(P)-dependent oxidoreductase [Gammaproteobacteria bacterium]